MQVNHSIEIITTDTELGLKIEVTHTDSYKRTELLMLNITHTSDDYLMLVGKTIGHTIVDKTLKNKFVELKKRLDKELNM